MQNTNRVCEKFITFYQNSVSFLQNNCEYLHISEAFPLTSVSISRIIFAYYSKKEAAQHFFFAL